MLVSSVAVFVALAACHSKAAPSDSSSGDSAGTTTETANHVDFGGFTPKNVIIIHMDTLRADSLPAYGSLHDTLPLLDARGAWIAVDHDVATSSWTAPATASVLTGVDVDKDGVRYWNPSTNLLNGDLAVPTFAGWLSSHDVASAMFTGNGLLTGNGLDGGFDKSDWERVKPGNTAAVADATLAWIDTLPTDKRFVAFLQPMDVHEPFAPDPSDLGTWSTSADVPFNVGADAPTQESQMNAAYGAATDDTERQVVVDQIRDVYDEQILQVDRAVDALLTGLASRGHADDTLVVFAADHGESIYEGDPPAIGHGRTMRHELVRLPLMFYAPSFHSEMVPCVASSLDLFPTVLDAMGVDEMPGTDGISLLKSCHDVAYSSLFESDGNAEFMSRMSIESEDAQIALDCRTGNFEAYDLSKDPEATESLDPTAVPNGDALSAQLDARRADILATLPGLTCP